MNRRDFIKYAGMGLALSAVPGVRLFAAEAEYIGKLFMTIRAGGGWDQTLFCDPKINVPGEKKITHWSDLEDMGNIGNLTFAPFGGTPAFYERHYKKMLVVNGINTRRNAHKGAALKMNTGDQGGYPSVSAMFAAVHGDNLLLPWLADGGHGLGIATRNRVTSDSSITSLISPNHQDLGADLKSIHTDELNQLRSFVADETRLLTSETTLPRAEAAIRQFGLSVKDDPRLELLGQYLTSIDYADFPKNKQTEKVAFSMACFAAGLSVSAEFSSAGFDTHNRNDLRQNASLNTLYSQVDFAWHLAEQWGLDDRFILQLETDFGRTPYYNGADGKDHWSVGSKVIMEKNASYTNRMVGGTDEGLKALRFDPVTLEPLQNGTQIEPKHIVHALREHLGVNTPELANRFDLNVPLMPFFL